MGVGRQRHNQAALPPEKNPGAHWIGGWVGPRAGLEGCGEENILPPSGVEHRTVQPVTTTPLVFVW
jgi:hypothetical protein